MQSERVPAAEKLSMDGDRMRRLHPMTLVHRFLVSLPALLVVLLPLRNPDANSWLYFGILLLYGFFVVPVIFVQYLRFRYLVTPEEIIIHRGVFTYRHRNIPIERIQNIEIEQSLLPRLLGTAKIKIETAGSATTEGVIEYVSLDEARRIRGRVQEHQRARRRSPERDADSRFGEADIQIDEGPQETVATPFESHGRPSDDDAAPHGGSAEEPEPAERVLFDMPAGRVLLSGVYRFSLLYIILIFSATEYLSFTPEEVARWLAGDRLEMLTAALDASPLLVIMATAVMVAVLAWITGIVTNFNRFYGFRLSLQGDKLHTKHGLLTVSEGTIPLQKVQAFIIRSNPLMSAFGWYRLELQTMGFDPDERGNRVAAPFARREETMAIARAIRPVEEPGDLERVSRLMIRRTFVRYTVALSVLAGGAAYFWTYALWGFAALPVLFFLAIQQYRHHGFRMSDDFLFVRRGVFRQSLWIIPYERFQVFYRTQSLFQRRLHLQSVYVDTPGAGAVSHPEVVDLPADAAVTLMAELYRTFQRRLESGADAKTLPRLRAL